jgi:hypothetical protein
VCVELIQIKLVLFDQQLLEGTVAEDDAVGLSRAKYGPLAADFLEDFHGCILTMGLVGAFMGADRAGASKSPGPFLFPERSVQSDAPPHLVHVRGNHRGADTLHPSACPQSYCPRLC